MNWFVEHKPIADFLSPLFQAVMTLVIGGFAAWIAYRQMQIGRRKLAIDTYDRRLKVYNAIREIFLVIIRDGKAELNLLGKLSEPQSESDFLFDTDIQEYLEEIRLKIIKLWELGNHLFGPNAEPVGEKRSQYAQDEGKILAYFFNQPEVARKKFQKYLNLWQA